MQENFGEIFTRRWVAETLLDLVGYQPQFKLAEKIILEPSVGTGAFLVPIIERLLSSLGGDKELLRGAFGAIRAYDLQVDNVNICREKTKKMLVDYGLEPAEASALAKNWVRCADFLLESDVPSAHFIVGNPPYIRIEDLPRELSAQYRSSWATMKGRADVFVGFFERSLRLLKPEARMAFICADRWMRNQYGGALRELITQNFAVEAVWIMHDVDAFETEVSAYPAITVIANRKQGQVIVADATHRFAEESAKALMEWTRAQKKNTERFCSSSVSAYRLETWFSGADPWPKGNAAELALIRELESDFLPLESIATGTKVSIGVATGSDKAYVVKAAEVERSRLLPLSMVGDLHPNGDFVWGGNYLVNPWTEDGDLIDLADFPLTKRYLEEHDLVKKRYVAQKQPTAWYRTIDKVNPRVTNEPKLLIQDMRSEINPVLERGGHYPHHNLYFITSRDWDLEVLGGLLLSAHVQILIGAYAVRMRGGTIRFQSQFLRLIRLPEIRAITDKLADELRQAFRIRSSSMATLAAEKAYNIRLDEYGLVGEAADANRKQRHSAGC